MYRYQYHNQFEKKRKLFILQISSISHSNIKIDILLHRATLHQCMPFLNNLILMYIKGKSSWICTSHKVFEFMLQQFFLRASCGEGASQALQSLTSEAGLPHLGLSKFFTIVHNYLLSRFIFLFICVFLFFSRWSCIIGSMEASLLSMGNAKI